MILYGHKTQEYRELKPYWHTRLYMKKYDAVLFRNGYSKDSPQMLIELERIGIGQGAVGLGAPEQQETWILYLGKILSTKHAIKLQ